MTRLAAIALALFACSSSVPTIAPWTGTTGGDTYCFTMLVKTPTGTRAAIACSNDERLCFNAQRTAREQGGLAGIRGVSECAPAVVTFLEKI